MGRITPAPGAGARRAVPSTIGDFERERVSYNNTLADLRRTFRGQWVERTRREEAAAAQHRAGLVAAKIRADAVKTASRETALAAEAAKQATAREASVAKKEARASVEYARLAKVASRRTRWLDMLERDAKTWIGEGEVEARITPDLFEMKYAWQVRETEGEGGT
jgi:hypothetical protein